jgi:hypothetical protein
MRGKGTGNPNQYSAEDIVRIEIIRQLNLLGIRLNTASEWAYTAFADFSCWGWLIVFPTGNHPFAEAILYEDQVQEAVQSNAKLGHPLIVFPNSIAWAVLEKLKNVAEVAPKNPGRLGAARLADVTAEDSQTTFRAGLRYEHDVRRCTAYRGHDSIE